MRFTHVTLPNEELFKIIYVIEEYSLFARLELQTFLADNEKTAAMLKGRPSEVIKEYVRGWIAQNYPSPIRFPFSWNFVISVCFYSLDHSRTNNTCITHLLHSLLTKELAAPTKSAIFLK